MATSTPARLTAAGHLEKAYEAEQKSRSLSVRYSTFSFTSQFEDGATPVELAEMRSARDSYSRLAAAHRAAARRMERWQRIARWLGRS